MTTYTPDELARELYGVEVKASPQVAQLRVANLASALRVEAEANGWVTRFGDTLAMSEDVFVALLVVALELGAKPLPELAKVKWVADRLKQAARSA